MRFPRVLIVFMLAVFSIHCAAIEAETTHTLVSKTVSYNTDTLISRDGTLGFALGPDNLAILDLSDNRIDTSQQVNLNAFKRPDARATGLSLSPREDLLYVDLKHDNREIADISLVFSIDADSKEATYLRTGPAINSNVVFTPDQNYLLESTVIPDNGIRDAVLVITVYQHTREEDSIVSSQRVDIANSGTFSGLPRVTLHGNGTLMITELSYEYSGEVLLTFRRNGAQLSFLREFTPQDLASPTDPYNIDYLYLLGANADNSKLIVSAHYTDTENSANRTFFVDLIEPAQLSSESIDQHCRALPERLNPDHNFVCSENENFTLSYYRVSETDTFDLQPSPDNLDFLYGQSIYLTSNGAHRWSDSALRLSPLHAGGVKLEEFGQDLRSATLDESLYSEVSVPGLNEINGWGDRAAMTHTGADGSMFSSRVCEIINIDTESHKAVVAQHDGMLDGCEYRNVVFLEQGKLLVTMKSRFEIELYRIDTDVIEQIARLPLSFPDDYRIHLSSSIASVSDRAFVVTLAQGDYSTDRYGLFEIQLRETDGEYTAADVILHLDNLDDHRSKVYPAPWVNGWLYKDRDLERSGLYYRETEQGPVNFQPMAVYGLSHSGAWRVSANDLDQTVHIRKTPEQSSQVVTGYENLLLRDDQWLVTHVKLEGIYVYKNLSDEWTEHTFIPLSDLSVDFTDLEYQFWFVREQYFQFLYEVHDEVRLTTGRWMFAPPDTAPDTFTLAPGETGEFDLLANDIEGDNAIVATTLRIDELSDNATVKTEDGVVFVTPDPDMTSGTVSFSYTVADTYGNISHSTFVDIDIREPAPNLAAQAPEMQAPASSGNASGGAFSSLFFLLFAAYLRRVQRESE